MRQKQLVDLGHKMSISLYFPFYSNFHLDRRDMPEIKYKQLNSSLVNLPPSIYSQLVTKGIVSIFIIYLLKLK